MIEQNHIDLWRYILEQYTSGKCGPEALIGAYREMFAHLVAYQIQDRDLRAMLAAQVMGGIAASTHALKLESAAEVSISSADEILRLIDTPKEEKKTNA